MKNAFYATMRRKVRQDRAPGETSAAPSSSAPVAAKKAPKRKASAPCEELMLLFQAVDAELAANSGTDSACDSESDASKRSRSEE